MTEESLADYITRLGQERDELKENYKEDHAELLMARSEIESLKSNLEEFARRADFAGKENDKLKQENKELKKQIESDKGLITVGGKQQYQYLQRINELEQENKEEKKAYNECVHYLACMTEQRNKLKTALEEIKRITEEDRNCMNSELACCCLCDKLDLIKDKINGVLGDEA